MKKSVIVLGPPRSGTSLTAGILSKLGVDMGYLRAPDFENPKGYFEDVEFSRIMENLFKIADENADGFNPPESKEIEEAFEKIRDSFIEYIQKRSENSRSEIWGWKVPTTVFVIKYLIELLPDPYLVVVLRNPLKIAHSMIEYTRNKEFYRELSLIESLSLVMLYYTVIFDFLKERERGLKWMAISYEDLLEDPEKQISRLAEFLGIKVRGKELRAARKLVDRNIKMKKKLSRHLTRIRWRLESIKNRINLK